MKPKANRQLLAHVVCPSIDRCRTDLPRYFEGYLEIFAVFKATVFSFISSTISQGILNDVLRLPHWGHTAQNNLTRLRYAAKT